MNEIKALRTNERFVIAAKYLIAKTERIKQLSEEVSELRGEVFEVLSGALREGEKSISFNDHRLSVVESAGRRTLDMNKLLRHVPASVIEKCYTVGEPPKPTVSVSRIADDVAKAAKREKKDVVRRVVKKLRRRGVE
jgi:hypothetical protein